MATFARQVCRWCFALFIFFLNFISCCLKDFPVHCCGSKNVILIMSDRRIVLWPARSPDLALIDFSLKFTFFAVDY